MRRSMAAGLLVLATALAGCSGAGGPGVALPPPPTYLPGDTAPPPSAASSPTAAAPFTAVQATALRIAGFGSALANFVPTGGSAVDALQVSHGRVSGFTLSFTPPVQFYDALRRVTSYLPPDATIRYVQSPSHQCRQVEFRSLTLTQGLGVPAVLVEFLSVSKSKHPGFQYNSVISARFTVWPLGDRSAPC